MNKKLRAGGENSPGAHAANGSANSASMQKSISTNLGFTVSSQSRFGYAKVLAIGTRSEGHAQVKPLRKVVKLRMEISISSALRRGGTLPFLAEPLRGVKAIATPRRGPH